RAVHRNPSGAADGAHADPSVVHVAESHRGEDGVELRELAGGEVLLDARGDLRLGGVAEDFDGNRIAGDFDQAEVRAELRRLLELDDLQRVIVDADRVGGGDAGDELAERAAVRVAAERARGDHQRRVVVGGQRDRAAAARAPQRAEDVVDGQHLPGGDV